MASEAAATSAKPHGRLRDIRLNRYVLAAALTYAGASGASQCLSLWQPQIIKSFGLTTMQTGLLNSVPFGISAVCMLWWGQHADCTKERVWHSGGPLASAIGCVVLWRLTRRR